LGPLSPNEVSRIAQYVRKEEGRKEGNDGEKHIFALTANG
jgi:hypothetical protein